VMAKQLEDKKTIDLLAGEKRGRGRPPVENPLSNAERQRLFRQRKKAGLVVTKKVTKIDPAVLREKQRADALAAALELMVEAKLKKKGLPSDVFARIVTTANKFS
jgi:hypothetical protein